MEQRITEEAERRAAMQAEYDERKRRGEEATKAIVERLQDRYGSQAENMRRDAIAERKRAMSDLALSGISGSAADVLRRSIDEQFAKSMRAADNYGKAPERPAKELGALDAGSRQVADMTRRLLQPGSMKDQAAKIAKEQLEAQKQIAKNTAPKTGQPQIKVGMGI